MLIKPTAAAVALSLSLALLAGCKAGNNSGSATRSSEKADGGSGRAADQESTMTSAGRYTIVHSPQAERDTILLDTATGRTWSRVELADRNGLPAWEEMPQLPRKPAADQLLGPPAADSRGSQGPLTFDNIPPSTSKPAPAAPRGG